MGHRIQPLCGQNVVQVPMKKKASLLEYKTKKYEILRHLPSPLTRYTSSQCLVLHDSCAFEQQIEMGKLPSPLGTNSPLIEWCLRNGHLAGFHQSKKVPKLTEGN